MASDLVRVNIGFHPRFTVYPFNLVLLAPEYLPSTGVRLQSFACVCFCCFLSEQEHISLAVFR